jgi:hypothetical protein
MHHRVPHHAGKPHALCRVCQTRMSGWFPLSRLATASCVLQSGMRPESLPVTGDAQHSDGKCTAPKHLGDYWFKCATQPCRRDATAFGASRLLHPSPTRAWPRQPGSPRQRLCHHLIRRGTGCPACLNHCPGTHETNYQVASGILFWIINQRLGSRNSVPMAHHGPTIARGLSS